MRRFLASMLGVVVAVFCVAGLYAPAVAEEEAAPVEVGEEQLIAPAPIDVEVEETLNFGQLSELGSSYTSGFKIKNNGAEEVKVDLSFAPSDIEGLKDESKKGADWLAVVGGAIHQTVAAGEEKVIRIRVSVPADAGVGSQYARVHVVLNDGQAERYVKVRLDVAGEGLKYAGELKNSGVQMFSFGEEVKATAEVENTGTVGFEVKNFVQVRNGLSEAADWRTLVDETIEAAPGVKVSLNSDAAEKIGFGIFTVEQKITYVNAAGELMEAIRSQVVVNCPWWVLAVIGGVVLVVIILAAVLKHKKKQHYDDDDDDDEAEVATKGKRKK